jgi:phosphoribosyl-AMP cyclohydrolase
VSSEDKTYPQAEQRRDMSDSESNAGTPSPDRGPDLAFDEQDRLPAVAQDVDSGAVLMLAYVTPEAVARTRETGLAHYYSRSRDELWQKGQSSGHTQRVEEIRVDCDGDALVYLVEQTGGACHTGYESCFYRTIDGETVGERVFDPDDVYE